MNVDNTQNDDVTNTEDNDSVQLVDGYSNKLLVESVVILFVLEYDHVLDISLMDDPLVTSLVGK